MDSKNSLEGWLTVFLQILTFTTALFTLIRQDRLAKKGQDQELIKDLTEQLKVKDSILHGKDDEITSLRDRVNGYNKDRV